MVMTTRLLHQNLLFDLFDNFLHSQLSVCNWFSSCCCHIQAALCKSPFEGLIQFELFELNLLFIPIHVTAQLVQTYEGARLL